MAIKKIFLYCLIFISCTLFAASAVTDNNDTSNVLEKYRRLIGSPDYHEKLHGLIAIRTDDMGVLRDLIPQIMEIGREDASAEARAYAAADVREYRCWIGARRFEDRTTTEYLLERLSDKSTDVLEEVIHPVNPSTRQFSPCHDYPAEMAEALSKMRDRSNTTLQAMIDAFLVSYKEHANDNKNVPLRDQIQSARSYLVEGKVEDALPELEKVLQREFTADVAWEVTSLASALKDAQKEDKALELLKKLSNVDNLKDYEVEDLGLRLIKLGDAETAVKLANAAVLKGMRSFKLYNMMGEAYLNLQDWAQAQKSYALALPPEYEDYYVSGIPPAYHHNFAFVSYKMGQYEIALKKINRAISAYVSNVDPYAYVIRGCIYIEKNNFEEATNDFKKAIEIDPSNFDFHEGLAKAYRLSKHHEDAVREYEAAIKLGSDKDQLSRAYRDMALSYKEMGKMDLYKEALAKAKGKTDK